MTFLVGAEQQSYSVRKGYVYEHSRHIKAAIGSPRAEHESQCISLPDHECKAFGSFLEWLYKGRVDLSGAKPIGDNHHLLDDGGDGFRWALGRLYVLGDFLEAHKFKMHLLRLVHGNGYLLRHYELLGICGPSSGMIAYVYSNTTDFFHLRASLADW